jgi:site-specific recombinase XerD
MKDDQSESKKQRHHYELIGETVRIYRRGDMWYANFQHEGRQHRQSLHTRSRKQARLRAIQLEGRLLDGRFTRQVNAPTITSTIDKYMESLRAEGRARKTLQKYENVFERLGRLAEVRRVTKISGVNLDLLDAYKSQRVAEGAAGKTVHTETVVIRQLVNFALRRKMISTDPLDGLKLRKPKPRSQPCWSRQEVDRILAAAKEPYKSMLAILAECGMRVGELKHLTWDDIDFGRGVILIREKDGWKPKTGDQRAVPMNPAVRAVLERLPRNARWVVAAPASRKYPKGDHQISERRLLEYLKRVLQRLGLRGHLHTFRHSFISHALTQGTPEAIVRQWVGHVDPEVLKIYTHVLDEASQAAMQRLAEADNHSNAQKGKEAHDDCTDEKPDQAQNKHTERSDRDDRCAK